MIWALWCTTGALVSTAKAATPVEPLTAIALRKRLFEGSGKPMVINFWATWCGPCVAEIPKLVSYAKSHPGVDVVMVNLDLPKLRSSHVVPFLDKHAVTNITHLQLDSDDPAKGILQVLPNFPDVVPLTLVVDSNGIETGRFSWALTDNDLSKLP